MKKHSVLQSIVAAWCAVVIVLCGAACGTQSDGANSAEARKTPMPELTAAYLDEHYEGYRTDFYEAVNKEAFASREISDDELGYDHFSDLQNDVTSRMHDLASDAAKDAAESDDLDVRTVGTLWATGMDKEGRNAGGFGVVQQYIDDVDAAKSIQDLMGVAAEFGREYGLYSFLGVSVGVDAADSARKVHGLLQTDTGLTREEWYADAEETQQRVGYFKDLLGELWQQAGASPEEATRKVDAVTAAMKDLAKDSLTLAEQYDSEKTYNVYKVADLEKMFRNVVPFDRFCEAYDLEPSDDIVISEVQLVTATIDFLETADLQLTKDYIKTVLFNDIRGFGTYDAYEKSSENFHERMGMPQGDRLEADLLDTLNDYAPFECGRLYADKYYDPAVEEDIQTMVDDIVEVYERRIGNLDWMGEETKAAALKKLSTIDARIGVPDKWPQAQYNQELSLKMPEEGGLFIDNMMEIWKVRQDLDFSTVDEPVDKTQWDESPLNVNAYYDPTTNSIILMAAILDGEFYSADASEEKNLGGIGSVIAHEITHAFDVSGSQYDENGNFRDWWSEEDGQKFDELSQKVSEYYSGQEIRGIGINGEQTLMENIADLGAVSCISDVAKNKKLDLKHVYLAYGQLWMEQMRDEWSAELLATDTHSPGKIRVNAVLSAIDDFYDAFDIAETDGMYVAPADRPRIW